MESFGKIMLFLITVVTIPIIYGFTVMKLWGWFIVPIFNVHQLRFVEAVGVVALLTWGIYNS